MSYCCGTSFSVFIEIQDNFNIKFEDLQIGFYPIFNSTQESTRDKEERSGQNMAITDPYSGKVMNLERVSNASSLRSTKSIGFIVYDK